MILSAGSDLPSFKTITLQRGLSVILADKSEGASDRQSRNGAGKTSFAELLHFLFGANVDSSSIFRSAALRDSTFTVKLEVDGELISASRSAKRPSRILCKPSVAGWPVRAAGNTLFSSEVELRNEEWKDALGAKWFGLPKKDSGGRFEPSFRSLFSMVARRQGTGGFLRPMQHGEKQQLWDQQATICHLIGLDASIPARFQELRVKEKQAKDLRRTAASGELGRYFGKAADLRTRLTVATARTQRLREGIGNFRVTPEYQDLERQATELTEHINALSI